MRINSVNDSCARASAAVALARFNISGFMTNCVRVKTFAQGYTVYAFRDNSRYGSNVWYDYLAY